MQRKVWTMAVVMVMAGCSEPPKRQPLSGCGVVWGSDVDEGADGGADPGPDSGPDAPPAVCAVTGAPGTIGPRLQLAPGAGAAVLVGNPAGDLAYSGANAVIGSDDNGPIYALGVTRLDAQLQQLAAYPHGSVVALDAQGDAYVAGALTQPTDLGTGVISPVGNVDVFLVKLSPAGGVVFARRLDLCGDGVEAIAVAADGRIAISGSALGTAVVDAAGNILFQLTPAGKLAFDAHGNLVIGGSFAGSLDLGGGHVLTTTGAADVDAFLVEVDAGGAYRFGLQLGDAALPVTVGGFGEVTTPQAQAIADVATGPDDTIAFTGAFRYEMDLFGQTLGQPPLFPSGQMAGSFVAKLDATGTPIFSSSVGSLNAAMPFGGLSMASGVRSLPGTAIVIDLHGDVVVSSNTPGNAQPPFAYPQLTKLDGQTGTPVLSLGNMTGVLGYGLGVAVDGCAGIAWATYANDPILSDPHTFIAKIAP